MGNRYLNLTSIMIIALILLISCNKTIDIDESIKIEYETACGWCAGSTLLIISGNKANSKRIIPCGQDKGTTEGKTTIKASDWEKLVNSYDHAQFLKLVIDQCGVCFDGCDERIKITRNGKEHQIRFFPGQVPHEVTELRNLLQDILKSIGNE